MKASVKSTEKMFLNSINGYKIKLKRKCRKLQRNSNQCLKMSIIIWLKLPNNLLTTNDIHYRLYIYKKKSKF